jgi:ferredoxin
MIKRMIVAIDEEKCTGCGKCISPCAEGAIRIIDGKAKVVSEELCDGMGFCIGICPEGAISIEERQTVEFDAEGGLIGRLSLSRRIVALEFWTVIRDTVIY